MIVLGFNGGRKTEHEDDCEPTRWHDAAAAIVRDGEIVAAVEEERLNRIKHSNCFPRHAIQYCLDAAGVTLPELDAIVYASARGTVESNNLRYRIDEPSDLPLAASETFAALFENHWGVDVRPLLRFCHHHDAHAWSGYALSGLSECLVASIDGFGDDCSGGLFHAKDHVLRRLKTIASSNSLGMFYRTIIGVLGFGNFDEYKAMGLAPYGRRDTYRELLQSCYTLLPDGDYALERFGTYEQKFMKAGLAEHIRSPSGPITQVHKDLAAALQEALEEIVLHMLRHHLAQVGVRDLCLVGGVAHNCTMNGRILQSGLCDRVFVQPAAHDAGLAMGAALFAAVERDPAARVHTLPHVYLGPALGDDTEVARQLQRWGDVLTFARQADIVQTAAQLLANGSVVGWVQGRSEFGPRALGHRSILADPRPAANRDRINGMVKKREAFRPFAPAVVAEHAHTFFEIPPCGADLSFMTYAVRVREAARDGLGATTHVDGTARVQVVSRDTSPMFWELLNAFGRLTGVPILLNTSFNNNAEPIVQSLADAVTCFVTTGLDYLIAGDHLIARRQPLGDYSGIGKLAPMPASWVRLVSERWRAGDGVQRRFGIAKPKGLMAHRVSWISPPVFDILQNADGERSVDELCLDDDDGAVLAELFRLWSMRLIVLRPPSLYERSAATGIRSSVPVGLGASS